MDLRGVLTTILEETQNVLSCSTMASLALLIARWTTKREMKEEREKSGHDAWTLVMVLRRQGFLQRLDTERGRSGEYSPMPLTWSLCMAGIACMPLAVLILC